MLRKVQDALRQGIATSVAFLISTLGKALMNLLLRSCSWEVSGAESFGEKSKGEKCLLALWHNRLAIAPYLLNRFVPNRIFAALISKSRDGRLLEFFVNSYKNGRTIGVFHNSKHAALKSVIDHVEQKEWVVVMTPDGPRGPKYQLKPGLPSAAFETQAIVYVLDWSADSFWQLNSWDGLRIPKPFSKIRVNFKQALPIIPEQPYTLDEATSALVTGLEPDPSNYSHL